MSDKSQKRALREQRDVIEVQSAEIERVRDDVAHIRSAIVEQDRKQQGTLIGIIVTGIFLVIASIGAPLAASTVDEPTPIECSAEKDAAYELWTKTDVWIDVPSDSPTQDQCEINDYMEVVIEQSGGDVDGGGGSDGTF